MRRPNARKWVGEHLLTRWQESPWLRWARQEEGRPWGQLGMEWSLHHGGPRRRRFRQDGQGIWNPPRRLRLLFDDPRRLQQQAERLLRRNARQGPIPARTLAHFPHLRVNILAYFGPLDKVIPTGTGKLISCGPARRPHARGIESPHKRLGRLGD